MPLADSVGIDFHKTGFTPYVSSLLLVRDAMAECEWDADLRFVEDGEELIDCSSALERRGYVIESVLDIQKVQPVRALGNPVRALDTSLGERIRCDAVAIALPPAPLHELASSVGAHAHWVGRLHGFAVQVDADGRTAVPWLFAAGRVAGLDAISSGEAAGRAAAT